MLTRLRVSGFKNLVDVDVRFGPFTCIAGINGVGKSNVLDAILFLSALADRPLVDAALSVRDEGGRTGDVRGLFNHVADWFAGEMSFQAEMIIPETGLDDLGQKATASSTLVQYSVTLRFRDDDSAALSPLELIEEELAYINKGDAPAHLLFAHSKDWFESAVKNRRRGEPYISTETQNDTKIIKVHQDGSAGRARHLLATNLPRTALSAANAAESPTAMLARREMLSWQLLQLEPSSLREPDSFIAPPRLSSDGAHLPAALYHLARRDSSRNGGAKNGDSRTYFEVAHLLSQLIGDVRGVSVDRDEKRELLTLHVTARDGTRHPARSLSDGTLRFLALAVLSIDSSSNGLLCLEEPENGIHPARLPAMIRLLRSLSVNVYEPIGPDNPLRQVIVNTHSPAVVMQVPEVTLLMAELVDVRTNSKDQRALILRPLEGTWRDREAVNPISLGKLLAYVNPVLEHDEDLAEGDRRVTDREDIRQYRLPFNEKIA
jgi:predicted ATPase